VQYTEQDLIRNKDFGRISLKELRLVLAGMNLSLAGRPMDLDHPARPCEPVQ